jgi:hypothetical protein
MGGQMNLKDELIKLMGDIVFSGIVVIPGENGNHLLSSGEFATAVTDERIVSGNVVIVVKSDKGRNFILGNKK